MLRLLSNTSLTALSSSVLSNPTNQSKPNAADHQPTPGSSALLSSPLKHQANCLQAIHKTIQQFNRYLKAKNLDRQALQLIALRLQSDVALLRYLLFSDKDTAAEDSATSPLINPNPNPNPISSALTLPCTDDGRKTWPFYPGGRCRTTQSENKQFCKRRPATYTQYAESSSNYGAEHRIKNLQTGKIVYRWNSNLHIHHCGDPFSILIVK